MEKTTIKNPLTSQTKKKTSIKVKDNFNEISKEQFPKLALSAFEASSNYKKKIRLANSIAEWAAKSGHLELEDYETMTNIQLIEWAERFYVKYNSREAKTA